MLTDSLWSWADHNHTFAQIRVMLTRPVHTSEGFEPPSGAKAVRAYAHYYPMPKDEQWWVWGP